MCLEELEQEEPKRHKKRKESEELQHYEEASLHDDIKQHNEPFVYVEPSRLNGLEQKENKDLNEELEENSVPGVKRITCPTCQKVTCYDQRLGLVDALNLRGVLEEVEKQELHLGQPAECLQEECNEKEGAIQSQQAFSAVDHIKDDAQKSNTLSRIQVIQTLLSLRKLFAIRP